MHEQIRMCIDAGLDIERQKQAAAHATERNRPSPVARLDLIRAGIDAPLAAVLLTDKKWEPGQTIKIEFLDRFRDAGGDADLKRRVRETAEEWLKYANLKFEWVSDDAQVRITFSRGGSWSYIGTDCLQVSSATMQFGWLEPGSSDDVLRRVVLHEFGHMLGLGHEHKHPEHGIPWDEAAVYNYYGGPPNNWSREKTRHNVLGRYDASETNFSEYDPHSIMHYPVDNRLTRGDYEVGLNRGLSEMDKRFAAEAYPFPEAPPPGPTDKEKLQELYRRRRSLSLQIRRQRPEFFAARAAFVEERDELWKLRKAHAETVEQIKEIEG